MTNILPLLPIAAGQFFLPQQLDRIPEPDAVMDHQSNVDDFNSIMQTNVSISLCGMIDLIGRLGIDRKTSFAIDLACGPGHFTLMIAEHLGFEKVVGVDLSENMLEIAKENAEKAGMSDRVSFVHGDVTDLASLFPSHSADLVTCTNSAHHLPDGSALSKMLSEMDRIAATTGRCAVMDLVRLKTSWSVERYVRAMGKDYKQHLQTDFRNSMFAAWTCQEMRQACKESENRNWGHFSISPVPINQFLFSFPKSEERTKLGEFTWNNTLPLEKRFLNDYSKYEEAKLRSFRNHRKIS